MKPYIITFNNGYDFRNCCGSREIGAFFIRTHIVVNNREEAVKEKTPAEYTAMFKEIMRQANKGSLIATTINPPKGTVASSNPYDRGSWVLINRMLRKAGWKKVGDYINPNTRHTVLLWHFK